MEEIKLIIEASMKLHDVLRIVEEMLQVTYTNTKNWHTATKITLKTTVDVSFTELIFSFMDAQFVYVRYMSKRLGILLLS